MEDKIFDIAIVGGGPAGLTTAIYGLRSGLSCVMVEKGMIGGQASLTYEIKNYPGYVNISGMQLSLNMLNQAKELGLTVVYDTINNYNLSGDIKVISGKNNVIKSKTVVLCMGAKARPLGIEKEKDLIGSGVAYCAVCDGAFYKGKTVAIYGSGESALEDSVYLSEIVGNLICINKRPAYRGQEILMENFNKTSKKSNVEVLYNTKIIDLKDNGVLEGVEVENTETGEKKIIKCDGLFVANGHIPDSDLIKDVVSCNEWGYIISDDDMKTNLPGVFVAGDIRNKKMRQVLLACADGAIAANSALEYINEKK